MEYFNHDLSYCNLKLYRKDIRYRIIYKVAKKEPIKEIKKLLAKYPDFEDRSMTLGVALMANFHYVTRYGNNKLYRLMYVQFLLEEGADVDVCIDNRTALSLALDVGDVPSAIEIIKAGCDVKRQYDNYLRKALDYIEYYKVMYDILIVDYRFRFIDYEHSYNLRYIHESDIKELVLLLINGATSNDVDNNNQTVLHNLLFIKQWYLQTIQLIYYNCLICDFQQNTPTPDRGRKQKNSHFRRQKQQFSKHQDILNRDLQQDISNTEKQTETCYFCSIEKNSDGRMLSPILTELGMLSKYCTSNKSHMQFPTLKKLCRNVVREQLGKYIHINIHKLNVPECIKDFILLKHVLPTRTVDGHWTSGEKND